MLFEDKVYANHSSQDFHRQLQAEQHCDPVVGPVKRLVSEGQTIQQGLLKKVANQLRIESNVLTKSGRPVLPASMCHFVTLSIHETAHFGTNKTYVLLKERFYWPNMYKFIHHFVNTCSICQRTKCDTLAPKAPMLPLRNPEVPMEFVSIEIAVVPPDDSGFKYILLVGDLFSKYIEAVPMKDQSAATVCSAFRESWIFKHESPYFLLSDHGSNVDGNLIHELCNTFKIEKRRSSAYHSQGSGFAERSIGNIREVL